jgi:hypothetical protein
VQVTDAGSADGEQGGQHWESRAEAEYWFEDAANIARYRVQRPDRYTANAEDYVDVLCWVLGARMKAEWTGPPVQTSEPTPPATEQSLLTEVR